MRGASHHLNQVCRTGLLVAALCAPLAAQEPPETLIRDVAAQESDFQAARSHYTYRQTVLFEELDPHGAEVGSYREVRDVIFSPQKGRTEVFVGKPRLNLRNLKLTDEDFRDLREVNPFVFTKDDLLFYHVKYRGGETMDEQDCFVYQLSPRQILDGQRLFDGLIWVSKKDRQIVRSEGRPVPQIYNHKGENLFPHFTTIYRPIDGKYWFPVRTLADDTLYFRSGPQRVRLVIRYDDYKRFSSESEIQYEKPKGTTDEHR